VEKFIIGIREHTSFGYLPTPLIVDNCTQEYCRIKRIVVYQDILDEPEIYTPIQKEILSIIDNYSDEKIYSYFNSNKKISITQFLSELTEETIQKHIRPFIEKHIKHLFDVLKNTDIEMYYKPYRYEYIYFSDRITLSKTKAQAIFHFDYNEEGIKYYLAVSYKGREIKIYQKKPIILLTNPALIELEHKLMYIEDIDANKLKPFYSHQFVSVPKTLAKKYFKNFVQKVIRDFNVVANGFEIINANSNKKAEIYIEKDWIGEYDFIPKFNYNGKLFKPSDNLENFVVFDEQKILFTKYSRDYMWELNLLNKLFNSGLLQKNDDVYKVAYNGKDKEEQQKLTINWLNGNFEKLKQSGFEIIQNFTQKQYFIKKFELEFKLENKIDWFDITAIVRIGEFEIPFYKFKNNILEHNNEYELPNGEIFIIPETWFSKYKNILKFSKHGKNKQLVLNKVYFFALDSIENIQYEKYNVETLNDFFRKDYKNEPAIPDSLKTNLRNYQKTGYAWLNALRQNRFGGILADDMGLGKTVQILTSILKLLQDSKQIVAKNNYDKNKEHIKNLIIVPRSLLHNWIREINKNTPLVRTLLYAGNDRFEVKSQIDKVDIVISSYGIVRNDIDFFKNIEFTYLVLDESQYIKNPVSKTYQAIKLLKAKYKVSLTGTPIENSLKDLWTQLNFVNNGILGSYSFFKKYFVNPIEKQDDEEAKEELKQIIGPFILRRTKSEVIKDLPDIDENIILCEMTDEQKILYEQEKAKIRNKVIEIYHTGKLKQSSIYVLQALTKLRQIANHPRIIGTDIESGKFDEVLNRLQTLREQNHKVLIFSSFVSYLELFEKYFKKKKCPYEIITGKTNNRQKAIHNFQNNEAINFFLISIKAGGVGINLTAADYVFILDPWWNPAIEQQAIARAHRIGQTKHVFAYKFITYETIEEKILKLQQKKLKLSNEFIDSYNYFNYFSEEAIVGLFD